MNIYAEKGDKAKYTGCADCQVQGKDDPRKVLVEGVVYTVERTSVGDWSSYAVLAEFPDKKFNTVVFKDV